MGIPPNKPKNIDRRYREYLTSTEIEQLILVARKIGRYGHRDSTMILLAYRHGLRVTELINLKWSQVNLKEGLLHIHRLKNGVSNTHPLFGPEIRALRKMIKDFEETDYVFITERKGPMLASNFYKIFRKAGDKLKLGFPIHPHMIRHSTGYKLANEGKDLRSIQYYLGHKNIQHTVRYTEISPNRFKDFWHD